MESEEQPDRTLQLLKGPLQGQWSQTPLTCGRQCRRRGKSQNLQLRWALVGYWAELVPQEGGAALGCVLGEVDLGPWETVVVERRPGALSVGQIVSFYCEEN